MKPQNIKHNINRSEIIAVVALVITIIFSVIPYTINLCHPLKLYGRVTGVLRTGHMKHPFVDIKGEHQEIKGTGYTLRVIITALNKNYSFKNFDIHIKYKDCDEEYKGVVIPASSPLAMEELKIKLKIPFRMDMMATNNFKKEEVNSYFIRFIIKEGIEIPQELRLVEYVEIVFYDSKDRKRNLKLPWEEIDARRLLSFNEEYIEKLE